MVRVSRRVGPILAVQAGGQAAPAAAGFGRASARRFGPGARRRTRARSERAPAPQTPTLRPAAGRLPLADRPLAEQGGAAHSGAWHHRLAPPKARLAGRPGRHAYWGRHGASRRPGGHRGNPLRPSRQRDSGPGSPQATWRPFHPPGGVLCTVPSRYFCAIGLSQLNLALDGSYHLSSACDIKQAYSSTRRARNPGRAPPPYGALTLYGNWRAPPASGGGRDRHARQASTLHLPPSLAAGGIQGWANPFSLAATGGISVDFLYGP